MSKIIIIIQSFKVSTSENENIDHQAKETCVTFGLSIQYQNRAVNAFLPFLLDLLELKVKDQIRRKINIEEKCLYEKLSRSLETI